MLNNTLSPHPNGLTHSPGHTETLSGGKHGLDNEYCTVQLHYLWLRCLIFRPGTGLWPLPLPGLSVCGPGTTEQVGNFFYMYLHYSAFPCSVVARFLILQMARPLHDVAVLTLLSQRHTNSYWKGAGGLKAVKCEALSCKEHGLVQAQIDFTATLQWEFTWVSSRSCLLVFRSWVQACVRTARCRWKLHIARLNKLKIYFDSVVTWGQSSIKPYYLL